MGQSSLIARLRTYDSSIKDILSAEDISELTSRIVYPLIAKAS